MRDSASWELDDIGDFLLALDMTNHHDVADAARKALDFGGSNLFSISSLEGMQDRFIIKKDQEMLEEDEE